MGGLQVHKDSMVWDVLNKGIAINLIEPKQTNGYTHTLSKPIEIKAVIPLKYADPVTRKEKKMGG